MEWIGTWCTLCLIAAAAMVVMIPYALDEIVALGQFLAERKRSGRPWDVFWHGDTTAGGGTDRSFEFDLPPRKLLAMTFGGGISAPWTLNACALIGVALMCTRLLFDTDGAMANSDHLTGSLVIVIAVCAWAEVARALRFLIVPLGAWLVVAPWLLDGASTFAAWGGVIAGLALIAASLPRGALENRVVGPVHTLVAAEPVHTLISPARGATARNPRSDRVAAKDATGDPRGIVELREHVVAAPGQACKGIRVACRSAWSGFLVVSGVFLLLGTLGLAIGISSAGIGPESG